MDGVQVSGISPGAAVRPERAASFSESQFSCSVEWGSESDYSFVLMDGVRSQLERVGAPRSAPGTVLTRSCTIVVSIDDDVCAWRGRFGCGSEKDCWTWKPIDFSSSPSSTLWQSTCAFASPNPVFLFYATRANSSSIMASV